MFHFHFDDQKRESAPFGFGYCDQFSNSRFRVFGRQCANRCCQLFIQLKSRLLSSIDFLRCVNCLMHCDCFLFYNVGVSFATINIVCHCLHTHTHTHAISCIHSSKLIHINKKLDDYQTWSRFQLFRVTIR